MGFLLKAIYQPPVCHVFLILICFLGVAKAQWDINPQWDVKDEAHEKVNLYGKCPHHNPHVKNLCLK